MDLFVLFCIDIVSVCVILCYMKIELEKLKQEIEANYKSDIAAVNQLLQRLPAKQAVEKRIASMVAVNVPRVSTSQIVEELIKGATAEFDISTVQLWLFQRTGRRSDLTRRIISQVINKLRQRNPPEIVEVVKGAGSRSGKYKYIKT
jgi:hypothetical protein